MRKFHTKTLLDGVTNPLVPPAPSPSRQATRPVAARRRKQASNQATDGQLPLLDPLIGRMPAMGASWAKSAGSAHVDPRDDDVRFHRAIDRGGCHPDGRNLAWPSA
jgi:hypothetical protein